MPDQDLSSKAQLKRLSGSLAKANGARDGESVDVDEQGNVVGIYREVPVPNAKRKAIEQLLSRDFLLAQTAKLDRAE